MVKKPELLIVKDRVSIVISREDRRHLGFIALERDMTSVGDVISYLLSHFDRTGRLKKQRDTAAESPAGSEDEPGGIRIL